jgi:hypothetical protein
VSAPIVIGRDHLDTGSVASPLPRNGGHADGSDAIADWAILNALLNVASGASWVSFHHGGGVGIGNSLHAGQVIVADGTPEARALERVLTNDPGIGVARHADAGYEIARDRPARDGLRRRSRCSIHAELARYRPWHVPLFMAKYALLRDARRPVLLNLEVTMRCNARCGFCDYWKTPAEPRHEELREFADIARRFNPMMITFTGGEPTLRRDLEDIVAAVREATSLSYSRMITHGGMLTLERAQSLWDAGLDQFNISLDYLDGRHDTARGIPGLTAKISTPCRA